MVEAKDQSELPRAEPSTARVFAVFPGNWKSNLRGDLTGGVIAAVLTIPMSIGFGLLAFAPFGERFLSIGILTGLYGAIFLGVVALLLGARTVTIYAPRSLIAFMIGSIAMQGFAKPPAGPLGQLEPYYLAGALLATLSLAGLIQMIFGAVRLGALVRFIPSPVMAGFQNAAALLILYSQLHIMLGLPNGLPLWALYAALPHVKLLNLALGAATVAVIWIGGRMSRYLPPALLGLLFGTLVYYLLVAAGLEAKLGPTLGPISGGSPDGYYFGAMLAFAVHRAAIDMLPTLLLFAFSFAVVASLDTLICSRIVEGVTGQRTAANRVLRLIGGANLITPLLGGICGGVSIGASTAGYKAGARTSLALLVHSAVIFAVVAALAPLLAKLPLVVVGAVLVVTALQLVDRWSLQLLRKVISRDTVDWHSTALDLTVILAVAVAAIAGDIAIAVLIGVGVAVVLFVLRMSRSIVRRERYGDEVLLAFLHPLLDRGRHLLGLAIAQTDVAVAVADDHECSEREPPAALHHLGDPVDRDHPLLVLPFRHLSSFPVLVSRSRCLLVGIYFSVVLLCRYSSRPASRAPSARPATRPWNWNPPRSNTTAEIPADFARSPTSLPTALAASAVPVRPDRSPASLVDAVASVRPWTSSITWA